MHQTHVLYDESVAAVLEWRGLESGVLAIKTPLEVMTTEGSRCIWFEPRKKRFVCAHGWGQYHLGIWNGPRAADFPKPAWTTCDCKSATGLCARKKLREEVLASDARAPSYYETLKATIGVTELRPGLVGARVPGVVGADGVRKPLSAYVGASEEFNLAAYFKGVDHMDMEAWDPIEFNKLSKVSANIKK